MRFAVAALVLLLAGCSCDGQRGMVVDLRSNFVPGIEFDEARTEVWAADNRTAIFTTETELGWTDPVETGMRIAEAPELEPGTYTVIVTLLRAGSAIAQRAVLISFDATSVVVMLVTRDCVNVICEDGLTCLVGICVPSDCLDGSGFDGCPAVTCSSDDMCDDPPIDCTDALCLEGHCHPFPVHDECGDEEWCNPDEGCRIFPDLERDAGTDAGTDAGPFDAGPDYDAGFDAGSDGGPLCSPGSCDDGNPCTTDTCEPSGCVFANSADPCDDGIYCNGADTCSAGACTVSAGDPCSGMSICDEVMDTCSGCATDSDCPPDTPGVWGRCAFGGDTCAVNGTRSRNIATYTCAAGACVETSIPDTGACSRGSRDGLSCGSRSCGTYGACDYSRFCDESGNQSRPCTDRLCGSGSCNDVPTTEARACSRSRGGMSCGGGSFCDPFGACGYSDECDESATQTRMCHDFTCGGGTCRDRSSSDTQPCSRVTTGNVCGSNPTYCGSPTRCHVCRTQSCVINTPHYDAACNPSCGQAGSLCGTSGRCCAMTGSCTPVGRGPPYADCVQCCDGAAVCF